ncbi:hypothetical protein HDU91_000110 [Kappamyces sp. JEL0680]|nr:hypothetical protein HDU91_000110 [Kappamyces sp. JEL0680]
MQDPAQPGKYLCKRCYHQQDRFKMVLKPDGTLGLRECSVCNAKDSSRWYKDVGKPGCYVGFARGAHNRTVSVATTPENG